LFFPRSSSSERVLDVIFGAFERVYQDMFYCMRRAMQARHGRRLWHLPNQGYARLAEFGTQNVELYRVVIRLWIPRMNVDGRLIARMLAYSLVTGEL